MAAVKGSKQFKVKVVVDRPYRRVLISFCVITVSAGLIVLSYALGLDRGMGELGDISQVLQATERKLENSLVETKELQQTLTNIELGAEVDRQASEDVRQEVLTLKEEIAALEEENSFYKGLMAPSENRRGLTIGSVELLNTDRPRSYRYKVVLQQLATRHNLLSGTLTFDVQGYLNGVETSFPIGEISEQYSGNSIKLRFKYFQNVAGELELPEGFEPQEIKLVAKSTGNNATTVEKRFGWLVQEI